MATTMPYGFRVVGSLWEPRRWVNASVAFSAYARCDPQAKLDRESYLSAFRFGEPFRHYLEEFDSVKGFNGDCFAPWIWFDIDRAGALDAALADCRRLVGGILERYRTLDEDDLLLFFSGAKGFHVGLPTVWQPLPGSTFNAIARRFAEGVAERVGVSIDVSVYDKVRAFRAPNSRHPKTGLFKRRLQFDELMRLTADAIRQLAVAPLPFDVPAPAQPCDQAAADWQEAGKAVEGETVARAARRAAGAANGGPVRLQRETLEFIANGAPEGERHPRLFRAAGNLGEFNCPPALAHALLTEAGLDTGLPPSEVARQINCGLAPAARQKGESTNQTETQP